MSTRVRRKNVRKRGEEKEKIQREGKKAEGRRGEGEKMTQVGKKKDGVSVVTNLVKVGSVDVPVGGRVGKRR